MALNFPATPSVNQAYSVNGLTWIWDGVAWTTGTQYTASLYGTSSWAINAIYATTASYALNGGGGSVPANTVSSSAQLSNGGGVAFTSSNNVTFGQITGSNLYISGSINGSNIGSGNEGYNFRAGYNSFGNYNPLFDDGGPLIPITGNTGLGNYTLYRINGFSNTAVGDNALYTMSFGEGNVAVGAYSMYKADNNSNSNVAIGTYAMFNSNYIASSTAVGIYALNKAGNLNVGIGAYAGYTASSDSTNNTFVGPYAGANLTTGSNNIMIGSGQQNNRFSGDNNVIIGSTSTVSFGNISNNIILLDGAGNVRMRTSASGHTTFDLPITASLFGTASYAITASYALNGGGGEVPVGTVSSSAQLSNGGGTAFNSSNNVTFGSVTSSLGFLGTASYALDYSNRVRTVIINDPAAGDQATLMYTQNSITVGQINAVVRGPTTPTASFFLRYNSSRAATTTDVVTAGTTVSSSTVAQLVTTFNNPTIPADNWVWVVVNTVSGTVAELAITIET